jgi:hypothetical protein
VVIFRIDPAGAIKPSALERKGEGDVLGHFKTGKQPGHGAFSVGKDKDQVKRIVLSI